MKTIAQIPEAYGRKIEVVINDKDSDIVARNMILLLIALVIEDPETKIDSIIHIWYSASLRRGDIDILQNRIRPLVEDVCRKVENKKPTSLLAKTWTFATRKIRVVLRKTTWQKVLKLTETDPALSLHRADEIRKAVTLAKCRKDYLDRYFSYHSSSQRISLHQFRKDGILLPFAADRTCFDRPNP